MEIKTRKIYSEAFKIKVLQELERGIISKCEAIRRYSISPGALYQWIRKYRKLALLERIIRVEMPNEKDKIKELEKQVRNLEKALANTQIKHLLTEAKYQVLLEEYGIQDREAFEKKLDAKLSQRP